MKHYYCANCGKEICHYEEVCLTGEVLTQTFKCDDCGFYGEQQFKITYIQTIEL